MLADDLGHLLRRAHAASVALGPAAGLPADRHPSDMAVVAAVDALGPASQRLLADRLAINPRVMVAIVDRLEADGIVARERDPRDRRSNAVSLTTRGRETADRMAEAADRHTALVTRGLTAARRRRLNELLALALAAPAGGLPEAPPPLTERTGFLLARAHFAMSALTKQELAPLGHDPLDALALMVVDAAGPVSQQRVATELGVSGTMLVQIADRLEHEALVDRRRDPADRRVLRLSMTPAGSAALGAARPLLAAAAARFTAPLPAGGDGELADLLRRLLAGAAGPPDPGTPPDRTPTGPPEPQRQANQE